MRAPATILKRRCACATAILPVAARPAPSPPPPRGAAVKGEGNVPALPPPSLPAFASSRSSSVHTPLPSARTPAQPVSRPFSPPSSHRGAARPSPDHKPHPAPTAPRIPPLGAYMAPPALRPRPRITPPRTIFLVPRASALSARVERGRVARRDRRLAGAALRPPRAGRRAERPQNPARSRRSGAVAGLSQ